MPLSDPLILENSVADEVFGLYACGLGLCPFIGLACDLLLRRLRGHLPESALKEEHFAKGHRKKSISLQDLNVLCLEGTSPVVPYLP